MMQCKCEEEMSVRRREGEEEKREGLRGGQFLTVFSHCVQRAEPSEVTALSLQSLILTERVT